MDSRARRYQDTAILSEGSPCSPCVHAAQCAQGLLACDEFAQYIATPGSSAWAGPTTPDRRRFPTREIYVKVHAHHPTKGQKAWRLVARARTARHDVP